MDKRLTMVVAMLAVVLYAMCATRQARHANVNMGDTDQFAYMTYAKEMQRSHFEFVGGRNRMPLYPALMALFYADDMSNEAFFNQGKHIGIAIGLVVLIVAFLLFAHRANTMDAGVATLVVMFTVMAFKAPAFQADVLYYGLFLILFTLMLRVLRVPHLALSVLAGAVAALTHLTKASVLPAVLLFILCMTGQAAGAVVDTLRKQPIDSAPTKRDWIKARKYALSALLFVVAFLTVVSPYIRTSKARFGHYFYNANSTFYIWYGSWEEAKEGTRAHGDRVGWPDMPQEQIPSLQKYLREHTAGQIAGRFIYGLRVMRVTAIKSYGYVPFVGLYVGFVGLLLVQNRKRLLPPLREYRNATTVFFVAAFFSGYLLLYAWYVPIASGNRLFLALLLPALYIMVQVLNRARKEKASIRLLGRSIPAWVLSPVVFVLLLYYVAFKLPHYIQTIHGYT